MKIWSATPKDQSRWLVTPVRRSLMGFRDAWDRLNTTQFGSHPLLDSRFVEGLLQQFGTGREVLAARYVGDQCDAMCVLEFQGRGVWCSFLPSQAQVAPMLIGEASQLNGLLQALPGHALQLDLLCCDPRLSRIWTGDCEGVVSCHPHAITISIALNVQHAEWERSLQRSLRNNLKRYEKRAQAEGQELRFVQLSDADTVGDAVQRYSDLEGEGWKGRQGTALGSVAEQLCFYKDLMDRFAAQGQAHIFELWSGERLAASRITIRQGGRIIMLKTAFDESLREWAPGRLLLARVIQHSFTNWPGETVEFYTNATADQLSWGVQQRHIVHVSIRRGAIWNTVLQVRATIHTALAGSKATEVSATNLEESVETIDLAQTQDLDTERLFAASEAMHFQLGLDWWRLFERFVMREVTGSRILLLRRGGQPVAALPVNVRSGLEAAGGMVGALTCAYSTMYLPVARDDVSGLDLLPMVLRLREFCEDVATVRFESMDPSAPQAAALEWALRAAGYAVVRYPCPKNWYLPVIKSWEEYLDERPGDLRNTIHCMSKRLWEHGGRIEVLSTLEAVDRGMSAFHAVYERSGQCAEPVPEMVNELVRLCARRSWLRMGLVWLEEKPIAAQIWVINGRRALIYKIVNDETQNQLLPEIVLTAALMQSAFVNDRVVEIEHLAGDDSHKKLWMTHQRDRCGLVATYLGSPVGWIRHAMQFASRMRNSLPSLPNVGSENAR